MPHGQKTARPAARSSAGASVRQAASVTSKHSAMAGPLLRNLPKSAKNIIASPQTVVIALPTSAFPTRPTASAPGGVPRQSLFELFLVP